MREGKMRSNSQVIGDKAVTILKSFFPAEWVCREFNPDYGIDLAVELFEPYNSSYITTGEHIYFQVKGTENITKGKYNIYEQKNIEHSYGKGKLYKQIDVIDFDIETSLLSTVERMGSAVPVLLTVINILTREIYYICLNDYIEKVIIPEKPEYTQQGKIRIHIPTTNLIKGEQDLYIINWYAKRAKLFALFNKANYQRHELQYFSDETLSKDLIHFAKIIRRFDAWSASNYFYPLKSIKEELDYFIANGRSKTATQTDYKNLGFDVDEKCWTSSNSSSELSYKECHNAMWLRTIWDQLCNCGCVFEEDCKEWFLPTYYNCILTE